MKIWLIKGLQYQTKQNKEKFNKLKEGKKSVYREKHLLMKPQAKLEGLIVQVFEPRLERKKMDQAHTYPITSTLNNKGVSLD